MIASLLLLTLAQSPCLNHKPCSLSEAQIQKLLFVDAGIKFGDGSIQLTAATGSGGGGAYDGGSAPLIAATVVDSGTVYAPEFVASPLVIANVFDGGTMNATNIVSAPLARIGLMDAGVIYAPGYVATPLLIANVIDAGVIIATSDSYLRDAGVHHLVASGIVRADAGVCFGDNTCQSTAATGGTGGGEYDGGSAPIIRADSVTVYLLDAGIIRAHVSVTGAEVDFSGDSSRLFSAGTGLAHLSAISGMSGKQVRHAAQHHGAAAGVVGSSDLPITLFGTGTTTVATVADASGRARSSMTTATGATNTNTKVTYITNSSGDWDNWSDFSAAIQSPNILTSVRFMVGTTNDSVGSIATLTPGATAAVRGYFFRFASDSGTANWEIVSCNGTSQTATATSVPVVAGQVHHFAARRNSASAVIFYIDSVEVGTLTTTLPSGNASNSFWQSAIRTMSNAVRSYGFMGVSVAY